MREGWKRIRLQNVCDRVTVGHVGKTSAYYCDDGVKFLRTQNVGKNGLKLNDVRFITPEFHRSLKKSQLAAGDVLISRVVTDDMRCAIVPPGLEPANCANIILLRPGSDLNSRYLYHLVNSPYAQRYLLDRRVGSAQQVVNTKVLKDWEIPVPSRGEQEKIVAILDEAFAGIATAVANTEKNLANARELFESYLDSVFSQQAEGRRTIELREVCRLINGRAYKKSELLNSGPYPVLRVGNFFTNQSWYYSDLELEKDKYCDNGDLLYAWSASFGPRIWEGSKVIFHYHIWKVDFDSEKVDKKFLYYWFDWDKKKIKKEQGAGTTMIHVTKGAMENRKLSLPSITNQTHVVGILDDLSAEVRRLEGIYQRKLNALTELKQSLLQKAFSGDLTTTPRKEIETALA